MSKFGALVLGPAGAGKTTFCASLIQHLRNNRRSCFYVNLDPAADDFAYEPDFDIKDVISLSDVMEELSLGPNGGLIYCFEFLLQNLDMLTAELESVTEEYLVIIDMPGQIELYTHIPILPALVRELGGGAVNIRLCAAYLMEATFMADRAKFFAGTLSAMSAMLMLEVPHVNILSKMDLVKGQVAKRELKRFLQPDADLYDDDVEAKRMVTFEEMGGMPDGAADDGEADTEAEGRGKTAKSDDPLDSANLMGGSSFHKLNRAVAGLIDNYGMVNFLQLDSNNEDSVGAVLSYIDDAIQFHEAQEPREPRDEEAGDMDYDYGGG